jgi:hypothetical protein
MTQVQTKVGSMTALPSKRSVLSKFSSGEMGLTVPKEDIYTSEFNVWLLIDEGWKFVIPEDGKVLGYRPPTLTERIRKE